MFEVKHKLFYRFGPFISRYSQVQRSSYIHSETDILQGDGACSTSNKIIRGKCKSKEKREEYPLYFLPPRYDH